jgi:hypothetical protein
VQYYVVTGITQGLKVEVLSRDLSVKALLFCFRYKRPIRQVQSWRSATIQVEDHLQGTESSMGRDFYVTH